jgi:hypothetical protein
MGLLPAEVIKSKLEAAGIPALLRYQSAGPVIGITVDGLGEVEVLVPAHLEEDALSLIEPLEAEDAFEEGEWEEAEGEDDLLAPS